ncbi:UvrD-helicase domain-containing protein [Streptomyces sp. NPDC008139]|uniref:UvrD-helicase domain-containing protein n=1 Tax=Streptomyces sp. NPDC008139 TaxID=3364814 RepID=UPI0036E7ED15
MTSSSVSSASSATSAVPHQAHRGAGGGGYRLVRTPPVAATPPVLDAAQRAVVEHGQGPLLVLAGPGTGKTTTLVEAVTARVRAGTDPDRILVLTFSRKAAVELRDRLAARAAAEPDGPGGATGGVVAPHATTFHSFCYALVREHQAPELFADPIRLLSGPEQDLLVRELLAGEAMLERDGRGKFRWPDDLRAARTTRGFADEVRAVVARSRELGLGPRALADFARRIGRPDWTAAAAFLDEYLEVSDLQGVIDYTELVHRAALLAERPETHRELAGRYDAVFVDEYQDTDPAQVRLLQALAGQGRTLVAFGDPDQSIYAFRGADINGILDFPTDFPPRDAKAAAVRVLTVSRRAGAELLDATRRLTTRMPLPKLPAAAVRQHRALHAVRSDGAVAVRTYPTSGAELDGIADTLRRAHLEDGIPWHDMAVLLRSASPLPALRRALTTSGVPVHLDAPDIPLHAEPAVAPLLLALRLAAESAAPEPPTLPGGPGAPGGDVDLALPGGPGTPGGDVDLALPGGPGTPGGDGDAALAGKPGAPGEDADGRAADAARSDGLGAPGGDADSALPGGLGASGGDADAVLPGGPGGPGASPAPTADPAEPGQSSAPLPAPAPSGGPQGQGEAASWSSGPDVSSQPAEPESSGAPSGVPDPAPGAGAPPGQGEVAASASDPDGSSRGDGRGAGRVVVGVEDAVALLTSPLGGMDAADLRRLGRALREEERAAGHAVPRGSDELIAEAVGEPERLVAHDPAYARGALRVGGLLRAARDTLAGGGTAEEALWGLWDGSPWPGRLERAALRGGAGGRHADRDLDAVCALFETAARAEERTGGRGALNLIEELSAHDIVADTLGGPAVRPDAVRLMTAHRSKGLEWRLVVVAGVQDGVWPDLRRRGSLLEADRIGTDGLAPPLSQGALLAEERRLFYVAATRARERLLVTAVKSANDDGDQPSRFLAELGVPPQDVTHRSRRPLAVAALVAELRATTVDPAASPALRDAAARRLAKLAALNDDGYALVPAAHPDRWWGLYEPTRSTVPLRDRDQPVVLSGSALDQLANTCALQWFLGREVKAEPPSTAAQGFGNVVHVLADEVASGRAPADLDVLMERLDSVWDALAFDAPWKSRQEKENARAALERFLRWHVMERGRTPVATEHGFDVTLEAGDARVRIRGSMDRVETDAEGNAYVVDFKTGRSKPTAAEVTHHPQLAVYQLAVREGAVDPLFNDTRPPSGGAELVQLRLGATRKEGGETVPAVQRQEPLEGEWAQELLAEAAGRVLDERFTPSTGQHCANCAFRAACTARPEGRQVVE